MRWFGGREGGRALLFILRRPYVDVRKHDVDEVRSKQLDRYLEVKVIMERSVCVQLFIGMIPT